MRNLALAIAAVLTLALVAPAFAQPFADVPADHWAFDAIAELAAKGILEGYPDGTFKGDRAMTRYEMAMALARILARIEAIKIPPPPKIPPPEVRAADIQRLQRLINEFRAELSALGVRITAVEESLSALERRVRRDTTLITGNYQYVYATSSPAAVARNRIRLNIRGEVAGDFYVLLRARWRSSYEGSHTSVVDFDRLIAVWASPWGLRFEMGRQYWFLGPQGILLGIQSSREGWQVSGTFGGISLTGLGFFNSGGLGSKTYAARAETSLMAGWTFGVNFRADRNFATSEGSGWSVDVQGTLMPGITFVAEYASWAWPFPCPTTLSGVGDGCTALDARVNFDLGALAGMETFAPTLQIYYLDARNGFAGNCGFALGTGCTNFYGGTFDAYWRSFYFYGPVTAWGVGLKFTLTPKVSAFFGYESGRVNSGFASGFSQGNNYNALSVVGRYAITRGATLQLEYLNVTNTTTTVSFPGWAAVVLFAW